MKRKSYWSRTVGLLGGTAKFVVYTPEDIEMRANIMVRGRRADVRVRMIPEHETWRASWQALNATESFDGKYFTTRRDRERIHRAIVEAWCEIWTPETVESVFPDWFRTKWNDVGARINATIGEERSAFLRQQQQLLKLFDEWRQESGR